MASNVEVVAARLREDSILVGGLGVNGWSGILAGGVWTRRLKREPPGQTPEAFYASDKGRLIRPSAVVLDRGDVPHIQRDAIPSAYIQPIPIYLYAPATASGKADIVAARKRVYYMLNGWRFTTEDGPVAFVEYRDRVGILDSEEFVEAVYDTLRYEITSRLGHEV